jgi:NhaA family Na+:H+ antiporter
MAKYMRNKLTTLFTEFFESEKSSGILLLSTTIFSILLANSPWSRAYLEVWHLELGFEVSALHLQYDLEHWINDGLMAIFFLLIGLEIERELYVGELSDPGNASLPLAAAVGGMTVPALVYLLFTWGTETQSGFGIPMATDIAFALGILSLVGRNVPASLKIFLTALAVIDDVGAIMVIAIFYSDDIAMLYLGLAGAMLLMMFIFNRLKIHSLWVYLLPGLAMWYFILQSGIHASIAGVLLAFVLPFGQGDESSLSYRVQHFLHKPVAFLIMPIFALANTGIVLTGLSLSSLFSGYMLGIFFGLSVGKVIGIVTFSVLAIKLGLSRLPDGLSLWHIVGAGFLGGIGFTMAIFVTFLAFGNTDLAQHAKLAVLLGSLLAGSVGFFILKTHRPAPGEESE